MKNSVSLDFTVFTPTYNRACTLPRVYESLRNQTVKDFEWLIVDDGSTDNTANLVKKWQTDENDFDIRYIYQENQHKKVAHNRAVAEARGDMFIVLDSDDSCVPDAIEVFGKYWQSIPEEQRSKFVGVCCLCRDPNGSIVGDRFPSDRYIDSDSLEIRFRYKVRGEKWGCNRTDILKTYPFREDIPGLVGESSVWDAIAKSYKIRFFNEALRVYYLDVPGLMRRVGEPHDFRQNAPGQVYARKLFLDNHFDWFFYDPVDFIKIGGLLTVYWLNCSSDMRRHLGYWPDSWKARIFVVATAPLGVAVWFLNRLGIW